MSECGPAPQPGEPVYHVPFLHLCTRWGEARGSQEAHLPDHAVRVHGPQHEFKAALGEDPGALHAHPGYSLKNPG